MPESFRDQLAERLRIQLADLDVSPEKALAFASDVMHMIDRATQERAYEATLRQIVQRYAEAWSEHASRRLLDAREDGATEMVYEMIERQARTRAVSALRKALLNALEGVKPPADDLDFFEED
ncbi:MAG: hypothetical protein O2807_08050 [bacterium]|nr:hypothetical protein [bacterium]